jgi:hypothetical protein
MLADPDSEPLPEPLDALTLALDALSSLDPDWLLDPIDRLLAESLDSDSLEIDMLDSD